MIKIFTTVLLVLASQQVSSEINEIIDFMGDGEGQGLAFPNGVVYDSQGNIYVSGKNSNNVFRSSSSDDCSMTNMPCEWVEIINASGSGIIGQEHSDTFGLAIDSQDNIYVVGRFSDNVWRINNPENCNTTNTPCEISEIINSNGDGVNDLNGPQDVQIDHLDNVYVAGTSSNNVFRIAASTTCNTNDTPCSITEIIDSNGDGNNGLFQPGSLAIDSLNNVYVSNYGDNVFQVELPNNCTATNEDCVVTELIKESDWGQLDLGVDIVADSTNYVYVSSFAGGIGPRVFRVNTLNEEVVVVFSGVLPQQVVGLGVDGSDNLYIAGGNGNNVLKINSPENCSAAQMNCIITEIIDTAGNGISDLEGARTLTVNGVDVYVTGASSDNAFRISDVADLSDLIFEDDFE